MKEREGPGRKPFLFFFYGSINTCCWYLCLLEGKENPLLILIIMLAFVWHFAVYAVCTVLLNPLSLLVVRCGRRRSGGARKPASLGTELSIFASLGVKPSEVCGAIRSGH